MPRVRKPAAALPDTNFTLQEKKNLLSALKTKGFHVISTPESLLEDLPGRSISDIQSLISLYRWKKTTTAQQLVVRQGLTNHRFPHHHQQREQNDDEADNEQALHQGKGTDVLAIEAEGRTSCQSAPIESWFRLVHSFMDFRDKRDDLSSSVAESIEEMGQLKETEPLANIYGYISECMEGRFPRELSIDESAVIVSLLNELKSIACHASDSPDCGESEWLRAGSWWQAHDDVSDGGDDAHHHNHDDNKKEKNDELGGKSGSSSARLQTPAMDESSSCRCAVGTAHLPPVLHQYVTSCLQFSKIKKIAACLNPLRVPVRMLAVEQELQHKHHTESRIAEDDELQE